MLHKISDIDLNAHKTLTPSNPVNAKYGVPDKHGPTIAQSLGTGLTDAAKYVGRQAVSPEALAGGAAAGLTAAGLLSNERNTALRANALRQHLVDRRAAGSGISKELERANKELEGKQKAWNNLQEKYKADKRKYLDNGLREHGNAQSEIHKLNQRYFRRGDWNDPNAALKRPSLLNPVNWLPSQRKANIWALSEQQLADLRNQRMALFDKRNQSSQFTNYAASSRQYDIDNKSKLDRSALTSAEQRANNLADLHAKMQQGIKQDKNKFRSARKGGIASRLGNTPGFSKVVGKGRGKAGVILMAAALAGGLGGYGYHRMASK